MKGCLMIDYADEAGDAGFDMMADMAEYQYWSDLDRAADLIVSYGYHAVMSDLTEIVDKKLREIDALGDY